MKREEVLAEARKCVCGDRDKSYGSPERSFECIAGMWSVYLGRPVSACDVACMMALLKIVRAKHSPSHNDNWVDIAGYAACGAECAAAMSGCERVGGVDYGNPFGHGIQPKTM